MGDLAPYYGALFTGIVIATCGQILLKLGALRPADGLAQFLNPYTFVGLCAYAVAALLYIVAIKKIPLSIAYPSVACSYAVVALVAHYLWGEQLGPSQIAGILLIWGGILLIHRA